MMDKDFLPWFTGFWEGEGSVIAKPYRGKRSRRAVRLVVYQAGERGRRVLEYIRDQFGEGYVRPTTRRLSDPRTNKWHVTSMPKIIPILEKMLPHLRFRREEVERALDFIKKEDSEAKLHWWTEPELAFLKENYEKMSRREIAERLKRHSLHSVRGKARELGLREIGG